MKVWDRINCRWVAWRGSRAAWLRLPHAVAVAGCVAVGAIALRPAPSIPTPAATPTPPPPAAGTQPAAWNVPPQAFLPPLAFLYSGPPSLTGGDVPVPGTPGDGRPVPEPSAALLLGAAVVVVFAATRGADVA